MDTKDEEGVKRDETQINGQTEGPKGTDTMGPDHALQDNKRRELVDESANGLDSVQVRGGQDGRNNRGIGSMDMDAKNGLLRMGDQDDYAEMEVPDKALDDAAASNAQTNTGPADVTTAGPDDYASANTVGVPNAQKEAKEALEQATTADEDSDRTAEDDLAQTGTSVDHKPTY